jgi:acid stress-induced BolA-like protein IbaG/YrbA
MLSHAEIEQRFLHFDDVSLVEASGDGYHYKLLVVCERFAGQSLVARQQWVYAQLQDFITTGQLHALTMKTWTQAEWEKQHG